MKKIITTTNAPTPVGAYSQAIEVNNFVYCSGQIALHPETGKLVLNSIESETHQVMKNIGAVLKAAECDYKNVIKTAIFINDMDLFQSVNTIYSEYFSEQPPARSCVAVKQLPKGVNVEIEVIAYKG